MKRKVVLHLVTWFPSSDNNIDGIFIRRHIELLKADDNYEHIVVQKSSSKFSIIYHLLSLFGFFTKRTIGTTDVIQLPVESVLYNRIFWRYKKVLEKKQLQRLVKKYKPFLCHLHVVYGFGEEAVYLKKKLGIPFIITEHMGPFPFEWLTNKEAAVTQPIKEASVVVAVSTAQAKQIDAYTGVKALVIPNVVDEVSFRFEESDARATAANGFQLVFVGIYAKAKGVDYLLRVWPEFLKAHPGSVLHLVGDATGERMHELQALIAEMGMANSIQFHGRLSATELCKLHQRCDFYVSGSEWESFGLSMLEALFTGLPVLSTNCGGVTDFITAENGLLLENDQQKRTLLNGLLQMAEQLPLYNRKEIARNVRAKFSNNVIQENYFRIYKQVVPSVDSESTD